MNKKVKPTHRPYLFLAGNWKHLIAEKNKVWKDFKEKIFKK